MIEKLLKPITFVWMHCDCQAVIAIRRNKTFNGKVDTFFLRHYMVKQLLKDGITSIDHVESKGNLAGPLSKSLGRKMIYERIRGMRRMPIVKNQE